MFLCIRGKEFSYNENGKFHHILRTAIGKKLTTMERKCFVFFISGGGISQYSCHSYCKGKGEPTL